MPISRYETTHEKLADVFFLLATTLWSSRVQTGLNAHGRLPKVLSFSRRGQSLSLNVVRFAIIKHYSRDVYHKVRSETHSILPPTPCSMSHFTLANPICGFSVISIVLSSASVFLSPASTQQKVFEHNAEDLSVVAGWVCGHFVYKPLFWALVQPSTGQLTNNTLNRRGRAARQTPYEATIGVQKNI